MTPPLLTLSHVGVVRGSRPVLTDVTAAIGRGQTTAVVGLNGSGKSTLLRTLLREFPHTGRIDFRCGHDHTRPQPDHIGYVPQRLSIDPRLPLTVRDLVGLAVNRGPLFFGTGRRLKRVQALLDQVGVGDRLDTPVDGLSGGQLQRVLLALALDPSPELLLLDEPAAGIDFQSQQGFYELIADFNRSTGVTILLVSHDLSIVSRFAHHVLCLRDGVVACQGPPAAVLTPATLAATFGPMTAEFAHAH